MPPKLVWQLKTAWLRSTGEWIATGKKSPPSARRRVSRESERWQTNWRYTCHFPANAQTKISPARRLIDWSGPFPCQETGLRSRYRRDGSPWKARWIGSIKKRRPKKPSVTLLASREFLTTL